MTSNLPYSSSFSQWLNLTWLSFLSISRKKILLTSAYVFLRNNYIALFSWVVFLIGFSTYVWNNGIDYTSTRGFPSTLSNNCIVPSYRYIYIYCIILLIYLRVCWLAWKPNQSILKEINPAYSLEGLLLKLKLHYFGHLMRGANSLKKTLVLGKIEGKRRRGSRWWDD